MRRESLLTSLFSCRFHRITMQWHDARICLIDDDCIQAHNKLCADWSIVDAVNGKAIMCVIIDSMGQKSSRTVRTKYQNERDKSDSKHYHIHTYTQMGEMKWNVRRIQNMKRFFDFRQKKMKQNRYITQNCLRLADVWCSVCVRCVRMLRFHVRRLNLRARCWCRLSNTKLHALISLGIFVLTQARWIRFSFAGNCMRATDIHSNYFTISLRTMLFKIIKNLQVNHIRSSRLWCYSEHKI